MNDAGPRLSGILLTYASLGAILNLAHSARTEGPRRAAGLLALGLGLPATGELLATGPLGLLRHRTRPRVAGVPAAVVLGWYCVIRGSFTLAGRVLDRLPLGDAARKRALPPAAALVGTSLDLVLDPAGLDAGLWEWKADGFYAPEIEGPNGRSGVPLVNYLGWLAVVGGSAHLYAWALRDTPVRPETGRPSILVLLTYYLVAAAWAVKRRRFRYLLFSAAFPATMLAEASLRW